MPDWDSAVELIHDADVFSKLIYSLTGVYVWEFFLSLDFDLAFITGRKSFRWPMIFYFANRYLLLCALIGILVGLNSTSKINCQPLYVFTQFAGLASSIATVNLCLRTNTKAVWDDEQRSCVILSGVNEDLNVLLTAMFIYSTCFDFIVLLLNAYKLYSSRRNHDFCRESRLVKLFFSDGLIYFFIAFLANFIATVFMLLSLNPVMGIIFNVPAVVVTAICATRVIRRLSNFLDSGGDEDPSALISGLQFRSGHTQHWTETQTGLISRSGAVHVHVQTETLTTSAEAGQFFRDGMVETGRVM
ncbi:hypothetical protein L218DRAFT_1001665 [Marasmius fiardii PR-910]|nr:hypothetical protein L218DRAFT_1001665 [Marasmius fiardii PR-910]